MSLIDLVAFIQKDVESYLVVLDEDVDARSGTTIGGVLVTMRADRARGAGLIRQLRESRGWSWHDMAKELRGAARAVGGTSGMRVDIASVQRTIARWESPTGSAPGHRYQPLLAQLFAYTPAGAVALGPGSDFDTFFVALRHFGVTTERIQQLTTLVTKAIGVRQETSSENDDASASWAPSDLERLPSLSAVPRLHGGAHPRGVSVESAAQNEVFLPVVVKGRLVALPLGGGTEDDDTMSPLNRRSVISCGLTAAAVAALSTSEAAGVFQQLPTARAFGGQSTDESWAAAIYDAVLNPTDAVRRATGADGDILYADRLRPLVGQAMRTSLTSDFGTLEKSLPTLIGQAEAATITTQRGGDDLVAQQTLSDVYAVVGWTLIKADMPIGAEIAAQRAIDAAERAGDIPRLAAATRCLAEVQMRAGDLEAATRTALLAAVHLDRTRSNHRPRSLLLRGAALLSAAAASARRGDRREAHAALKAAAACAEGIGQDRVILGTVFGPTNVAIHEVAIAIELGDASEAVRRIPAVRLEQMPRTLTERRGRFLIDAARSYAQMRDDQAAIDALVESEKIAPDELRNHRLTRELVPQLLAREHRSSDLRALARRCNLLS